MLRRPREPVVEVRRRDRAWGGGGKEEEEKDDDDVVEVGRGAGAGGRRVRVVGKWPVWKVEMGRRRCPERDLGSRWWF